MSRDESISCRLRAAGITKKYPHRGTSRVVLDGLDLSVNTGETVAVVGRSGSGKSTLLNILGVLERPDSGTVEIEGRRCEALTSTEAADVRARSIGFVFQAMNLLPHLSVTANIETGTWPALGGAERERMLSLLDEVDMGDLAHRRAAELSLGEQQRVAVVRALVKRPGVVLADEPTGSLDADSESAVMKVLRQAANDGSAVVIVTHTDQVAAMADRVFALRSGVLVEEGR